MRETLEHSQLILELAKLGTWKFKPGDRHLHCSALAKRFFGVREDIEMTYGMFLDCVHKEDRDRVDEALSRVQCARCGEYDLEFRIIGIHDRRTRSVAATGRMLMDECGRPTEVIGIFRDITKQKDFEMEARRALQAADAAATTKTEFLAHMSHEIRTPLGAMLGFAELARDPSLSEVEREESLKTVSRNGDQLLRLINKVLDLSKIEADKLEIEKHEVPIVGIFDDVNEALKIYAQKKGIEVSFSSKGLVPKDITTDPLRIQQILINLVGNAIKFSEGGRVEVTVEMQRRPRLGDPMQLLFLVKDHGIGISLEQQPRLFKSFSQADSSMSRKYGGTGLGLVLSRKFARALGGNLYLAESAPGVGSTFAFTIADRTFERDVEMVAIHGGTFGARAEPVKRRVPNLQGIRVLLAEDARDNQVLVSRFLEMAGAVVEVAQNGEEAIRKVEEREYDLILMDLQMPVLDGYGATVRLRNQGYARPIIALTAHSMRGERERCLELGFDDHLTKPVDRGGLLEEVAEFARRSQHMVAKQMHEVPRWGADAFREV
ncbi:MAG: response regulator [Bdellovibrionaceae bacterium]|nr:response regulator [Pseudobdellovibrionaceae bacterium]